MKKDAGPWSRCWAIWNTVILVSLQKIQCSPSWVINWSIEYSDMKCGNPFESQMTNIKEISKYQKFDSLVCNISRQEGCPFPCFCYSKPSKRYTVVNCSSFYLTEAPKHHINSKHPVIYIFKRHSTLHGSIISIKGGKGLYSWIETLNISGTIDYKNPDNITLSTIWYLMIG